MKATGSRAAAALRRLDAATSGRGGGDLATLDPEQARRALATLERVVASDPTARDAGAAGLAGADGLGGSDRAARPSRQRVARPSRRRVPRPVVVLLAALVLVAVVVAVVVAVRPPTPTILGRTYVSWSPRAVILTSPDAAAQACAGELGRVGQPDLTPLLAETRGAWTYVVVRPQPGVQSSCLIPTAELADPPELGRPTWFAATGEVPGSPGPAPDAIEVLVTRVGSTSEGVFGTAEGLVGSDVAAVTVTTPSGIEVEASVIDGVFAAWWPAGEDSLDNPELTATPTLTVTTRDGTTRPHPG